MAKTEKQRYIPIHVTDEMKENGFMDGYKGAKAGWEHWGEESGPVLRIPVSEELYREYNRPEWRRRKQQQRYDIPDSLELLQEDPSFQLAADMAVEDVVEKKMLISALRHVLDTLNELDQQILQLYGEGYKEAEIGKVVGVCQKTVNNRKRRALEKIREDLKNLL